MKKIGCFIICISFCAAYALGADNPHGELKFDCETCHTIDSFEEMSFDHNLTGYELQNRHQSADCRGCHDIADFSKVKKNCLSCHQDVHKAKMGNDCEDCHTTRGWEQFDIQKMHLNTNFPISGRHALLDCQSCHKQMPAGDFSLNTTRCVECHQSEYLSVQNPEHANNGFSTECQSCHQMDRWRPAFFDNHDILFPIFSGTHNNEWDDCASCHIDAGSYQNFSCLTCHEHNQPETDSDHNGISGYAYNSPDCYFCHPTGEAGDFGDHDAQFFPIFSGVHNNEWDNCNTCHINPTDRKDFSCFECHTHNQTDTDNIHGGMTGYAYTSQDCYICHPTGEAGDFTDHDAQFFPIFSGRHNGEWTDCSACHTNPTNRSEFSCIDCHTHNQTDTDNIHGGMTGYAYASQDCYFCHPTGEAGDFTDHDAQFFPIFSGTHNGEWTDCNTCHINPANRSEFSCFDCHTHNQTDTDNIHGGMTGYNYNSQDCYLCHPTGEAGDFTDHDAQFFPIFSGTHNGEWTDCAVCHTTPIDRSIYTCLPCHDHNQTDMDNMHGRMTGYQYLSSTCYSCHPTGQKGTFTEHDPQFFPIFSGAHLNRWDNCVDCHPTLLDRTVFSCFKCHLQPQMDDKHLGEVSGYAYDSDLCLSCHPIGRAED